MIKKLLRLEFYKSFAYTNFWVMAGLWAGLYLLVSFLATQVSFPLPIPGMESKPYLQFPSAWSTFTWIASWFNLLLAILVIVSVGNEYSFKTFRSQIINGLSRNDLILGKGLFIIFLALCSMIIVFFVTLIFGSIYTTFGNETSVFSKAYLLIVFFIQSIAYMSLGMFIAILVRNTALAIVSFILYFFPIEVIVRNFFPESVLAFFPMKIISNLTPLPDVINIAPASSQMQSSINGQQMNMAAAPPMEVPLYLSATVALVYIAIFFASSSVLMNKRNL